jgi:hypothetical protein
VRADGRPLGKYCSEMEVIMNETPNTFTAESFHAMVDAYETWAEPLSARLAQVALSRSLLEGPR